MSRTLLTAALLAAVVVPMHAAAQVSTALEEYRLPNGLRVILQPDSRVARVTVDLWCHAGAVAQGLGQSGYAHLFEHVAFAGSKHIPKSAFDSLIPSLGGKEDAITGLDRTMFWATVPANALEQVLWMRSEQLGFVADAITPEVFERQKAVVLNERLQSIDNRPYGPSREQLQHLMFPAGSPYHELMAGRADDVRRATVADVRAFFERYYNPANATLVIVGRYDPGEARRLVDKYFGTLRNHIVAATPPAALTPATPPTHEVRQIVREDVAAARLHVGWIVARPIAGDDPDLEMAGWILNGKRPSVLWRRLVVDAKVADDARCDLDRLRLGSTFICRVTVKPGVDPARAEHELDALLNDLATRGPSDDDLAAAKAAARVYYWEDEEQLLAHAETLAYFAFYAGDPGYLQKHLARLAAASPDSVREAIHRWLSPTRRAVVLTLPEKAR
ncbi:MAG: peptidase domain protein [Myxococcales bacterium]|nr:peptidase domain protein [Myxococcales bacterium]